MQGWASVAVRCLLDPDTVWSDEGWAERMREEGEQSSWWITSGEIRPILTDNAQRNEENQHMDLKTANAVVRLYKRSEEKKVT